MGGVVQLSAWFPRGMDMREQRVECLPAQRLGSRIELRGENDYEEGAWQSVDERWSRPTSTLRSPVSTEFEYGCTDRGACTPGLSRQRVGVFRLQWIRFSPGPAPRVPCAPPPPNDHPAASRRRDCRLRHHDQCLMLWPVSHLLFSRCRSRTCMALCRR